MRQPVLVVAFYALIAWTPWAQAQSPASLDGAVPATAASAAAAERDDPEELARWFYSVMVGEIAANTGHPDIAYSELLQAARDMNSAALFERSATVALRAGASQDALAAVNAWREQQPSNARAQEWAARLLIALGRNGEATTALTRLIALTPAPQRPGVLLTLPALFARMGDTQAALTSARKVLAPYAQLPSGAVALGQLQSWAGDPAAAFAQAVVALNAEHDFPAAAILLLQNYKVDPQRADALMAAYAQARPDDSDLRMAWIASALDQDRSGVALEQSRMQTRLHPEFAPAWLVVGTVQLDRGALADAEDALLNYLRLARDDKAQVAGVARACLAMADASSQQGNQDVADGWLEQVPAGQEPLGVALQRAVDLARRGRLQAGVALLEKLPAATPDARRARRLLLSQFYRTLQHPGAAYRVLKAGLRGNMDDTEYVYETAMMAEQAGRPREMEGLLRRLIAAQPRFQPAFNALGYSLADQNRDLPEASRLVEHALRLAPGNPFVLDSMGWIAFRMGTLDKAQSWLEQAWSARPDPAIGAHLAEVLWHRGDTARARELLHDAWLQAPHDAGVTDAMRRMGMSF